MLVVRAFDVMGRPTVAVEEHTSCCEHGRCAEPDKRSYGQADDESLRHLDHAGAALWAAETTIRRYWPDDEAHLAVTYQPTRPR